MKKTLMAAVAAIALSASGALADYTFIVPQEPGGGTSVWATIVAEQLEPFLGEPVIVQHQPGARDIPGFNLWHNELRKDPKTIMVSHGGNGVAFLEEKVDYDYSQYESVGLMNLNIIAAKRTGLADDAVINFAAGSGMEPEAMAMTMLLCGPGLTVDEYVACFKEKVTWVKGMDGSERRLAFERGELNGTRETPAAFKKYFQPMIDAGDAELWFHHGLFDIATGGHVDDPNYPGYQFETLFEKKWGVKPEGEFYDSYNLVRSFRDVLQKALWMDPSSPNLEAVRDALTRMSQDPVAMEAIRKDVGDYQWVIGEEADALRDHLMTLITEDALQNLVKFNADALGLVSVYKPELVK